MGGGYLYFLYNLAIVILTPFMVLCAAVSRRHRRNLDCLPWRLGFGRCHALADLPPGERIWFHAASVGEAGTLPPLVEGLRLLRPHACVLVSVMTATGLEAARKTLRNADRLFYLPYDLPWAARRVARLVRPTVLLTVETEIWPNLLHQCKACGARILMVNGRISPRSFGAYRRLRRFSRRVLSHYDRFSTIGREDADRLVQMGAAPDRVAVCGNIKFDRVSDRAKPEMVQEIRAGLGFAEGTRVLVAGSTRPGEEEQILRAYRALLPVHPDLYLVIAPRHIERALVVAALVEKAGFAPMLRSQLTLLPPIFREREGALRGVSSPPVLILDTMGELFATYGLATIAFCGASLVPLGGQNPLEPAAWGKVVLYGPSMEDFREARAILEEAGAGFTVRDADELARTAGELLANPAELARWGEAGRRALQVHRGASARCLEAIEALVKY